MTMMTTASSFTNALHLPKLGRTASGPDAREAIFALVRPLRTYAALLLGNPAQAGDLVEAALRTAWAEGPSTGSQPGLRTRLFALLRRACHVQLSQTQRRNGRTSPPRATAQPADFRDGLAALPIHQREALILIVGEGFSSREAAAICGCSAGTITRRADRGRRKLAETPDLTPARPAHAERIAF